jgi:hypothetical protein
MTTTISSGATTITPELVTGWESSNETYNIVHDILSRSTPDITLRGSTTRSGTLTMLFLTEASCETARALHAGANVLTLASTEITAANFDYIVAGPVVTMLEDVTRSYWTLTVDYREIA